MKCPICKKDALFVGVHDDEGNYHGLVGCDYESNPWSGLSYALHHDGWGECPLCTDGVYSTMGGMLFDTAEEAIATLTPPNEWVGVEDRRTNADSIRAMDYDSLLDFFVELSGDIGCPPSEKSCCDKFEKYGRDACKKCWDKYLKSPVEEDT